MERIKHKKDDTQNKMRPGSIFISSRDDGLRYIDKDGAEAWTTPNSRYYAKGTIRRGQPVSIAQLDSLSDSQSGDPYAYVKVTDPDSDESCLGLAMNYAEEGQIVHVQSHGKFSFYIAGSKGALARAGKEVFINVGDDKTHWDFAKIRGQRLYLKKWKKYWSDEENPSNTDDPYNTAHPDNDSVLDSEIFNDEVAFTFDLNDSIYNVKKTIQIGYLVDAPTFVPTVPKASDYVDGENNPNYKEAVKLYNQQLLEEDVVTIEIEINGDVRGPVDHTQFVLTLGEDISFDTAEQSFDWPIEEGWHSTVPANTICGPDFNQAIEEEVKVVAINPLKPCAPGFTVVTKTETNITETPKENAFVAVRKLDGKTCIVPVLCNTVDPNAFADPNDEGYYKLSKAFASKLSGNPEDSIKIGEPVTVFNAGNIKNAIYKAFKEVGYEGSWSDSAYGADGYICNGSANEGWYDLYVSFDLLPMIALQCTSHGNSAEQGTAVLADIRCAERSQVVGVVLSNAQGTRHKGETIKVIKMGNFLTMGNMPAGQEFYLGINGKITNRINYWYDNCVKVGTSESSHMLIVDFQGPTKSYDGALPLGWMKPSAHGFAEKGFCVMDGFTVYRKSEHPELYEALKDWFSEDELKPSNVTPSRYAFNASRALWPTYNKFRAYTLKFNGALSDKLDQLEETIQNVENLLGQKKESEDSTVWDSIYELQQDVNTRVLNTDFNTAIASLSTSISNFEQALASETNNRTTAISNSENTLRSEIASSADTLTNAINDLSSKLDAFVAKFNTGGALDDTYVDNTELETKLTDILKDYVVSSTLSDYVTKDSLSSYATKDSLSDYATAESLTALEDKLTGQITALDAKEALAELNSTIEALNVKLEALENADTEAGNTVQSLKESLDELKVQVETLSTKLEELSKEPEVETPEAEVARFTLNGVSVEGLNVGDTITLSKEWAEGILGQEIESITGFSDGENVYGLDTEYTVSTNNSLIIYNSEEQSPEE